jgi:hypothetical protein
VTRHRIGIDPTTAAEIGEERLKDGSLPGLEGVRVIGLRQDPEEFIHRERPPLYLVFEGEPKQVQEALARAIAGRKRPPGVTWNEEREFWECCKCRAVARQDPADLRHEEGCSLHGDSGRE